jgi:hypothetical protein
MLAVMVVSFTITSLNADTYKCDAFSMQSPTPVKHAISFDLTTNEAAGTGSLTIDGEEIQGKIYRNGSVITIDLGEANDRTQFNIETDPSEDLLQKYIDRLADEYGMGDADKETLSSHLRKMFKDQKINGTQLVLLNVSSLLSCIEAKDN